MKPTEADVSWALENCVSLVQGSGSSAADVATCTNLTIDAITSASSACPAECTAFFNRVGFPWSLNP